MPEEPKLHKIETIAQPGNWLLCVSPRGKPQIARINADDTVTLSGYEHEGVRLRLPRLGSFSEAIYAFWMDGADDGLEEFKDQN